MIPKAVFPLVKEEHERATLLRTALVWMLKKDEDWNVIVR